MTDQGAASRRLPWWVFALTIGASLGIALFFYTGVVASDDTFYLDIARHWTPGGDRTASDVAYARIAVWYPIRVATWVAGDSWRALMWPPFVSAGLALLAVALLGRRWFGDRPAVFAVATLGLTPPFIIAATIAVSDVMATSAVAAALALGGPALVERDCKRPVLLAACAGLAIGLGYSAKETTALIVPAFGLFVLLRRPACAWAWTRLAAVAGGAALWLATEAVVLAVYTGDPFFHYLAISESQAIYGLPLTDPTFTELADHWTQYARWLMDPNHVYGWCGPVYLAAVALAIWRGTDARRLLLCVILCLGVYLSVGSSDLRTYSPLWHQPRHLLLLVPAGALLVGWIVDGLLRARKTVARVAAVAAVCLVVASLHTANRDAGRWYAAREFTAGRRLFEHFDPPPWRDRVCASGHTAYRLALLFEEADAGWVFSIGDPPASAPEWMQRYPGWYVVVSGADRRPPPPGQRMSLLTGESVAALTSFQRIASGAPPTSRAREVFSALGLVAAGYDESDRVEVFRVPQRTVVCADE
ncbi:MAG TPA: glycosyltransferase family 39 protein [Phycisphaerae bacterium]|nr:glycosyltransferase family 39 protein [Phycisphaerae bacterium]